MTPILLIVAGGLFLLMEFQAVAIQKTWPVLLIVFGLVKLLQHAAPSRGHMPVGSGMDVLLSSGARDNANASAASSHAGAMSPATRDDGF